ncbi:hypothetical protein WME75_10655 [Sorangium sp. So ce1014]|uniref:hypothetical protein n=1 Tax=Sorangium sp. So ce1014 TaxID=3133326 RepID=UPI003F5E75D7
MGTEAWIYIDESQAPNMKGTAMGRPFRIGALLVEAPIADDIIRDGLARLDTRQYSPDRALVRGHFHASEDSENAHAAFADAISNAKLNALFVDERWHFDRDDSHEFDGALLHSFLIMIQSLRVHQMEYDAIHMLVARRQGTFEERHAKHWERTWRNDTLTAICSSPEFVTRFPRLTMDVVNGSDLGVQVCDFVLWATQRARIGESSLSGNADFYERVGLKTIKSGGIEGGASQESMSIIGRFKMRYFRSDMSRGPGRWPQDIGTAELGIILKEIEEQVRKAARLAPGNSRIGHLEAELRAAVEVLNDCASPPSLQRVAEAFLLACDTLPLYDPTDADECVRVRERRILAAATISSSQYLDLWMRYRNF